MNDLVKYGIASILATILAAVFYYYTLSLAEAAYQLPRILIAVIVLLAIGMFLEAYLKYRRERAGKETREVPEEGINYKRAAVFALLIFAYILAINPLGYFVTTPVFIIGALYYLKAARMRTILIITVCFTVFVYLLFVKFLHLPIPLGHMS
ncbi:MAG: tripartite tricarboxylate transporter TctB family protein [Smithellaceae bacterium]|nr:tripartite tricarboxylate transporter TctB family protein [Smithellaceae bacterium]